jgi:hypothetical protein
MSSHPINLGLRFVLELLALLALGYWGSQQGSGFISVLLALGLPIIAAAVWGTFAVPDDPSRSGKAPVVVSGVGRLLLEVTLFVLATVALFDLGFDLSAVVFAIVVVVHYAVSYDRIQWLLKQ